MVVFRVYSIRTQQGPIVTKCVRFLQKHETTQARF